MRQSIPQYEREKHQRARSELVEKLRQEGIDNEKVLKIIEYAPRHCFIDSAFWHHAYKSIPLPISSAQTMSQPYTVAKMTELVLEHSPHQENVLEIGTGSGYQAYILSKLFEKVYTIERIESLYKIARQRFEQLDCINIGCKLDDGQSGWHQYAPYPAIMITAALQWVPEDLQHQLCDQGVLVAPIGKNSEIQKLTLIRRNGTQFNHEQLESVRFVPVLSGISQLPTQQK